MKYLSLVFIALFLSTAGVNAQGGNEDAISRYFDQYLDDERFTVVYISSKMFSILGKLKIDDLQDEEAQAVIEMVQDLRGLRVLTTEETPNKFYQEAINKINTKEYEVLMTVRDEGENVQFLIKDEGDQINELLLLVGGEDEFVMLSFIGTIDLDKISRLANKLDVKGVDQLDHLEDRDEQGSN